jgi:hypothetical protein
LHFIPLLAHFGCNFKLYMRPYNNPVDTGRIHREGPIKIYRDGTPGVWPGKLGLWYTRRREVFQNLPSRQALSLSLRSHTNKKPANTCACATAV